MTDSPRIEDLTKDIYSLFEHGKDVSDEDAKAFGEELASVISSRLQDNKEEYKPRLRLSALGTPDRKQWLDIKGVVGEELEPWTKVKFLFGDILEVLLLFLAKQAGHEVSGEQDEVSVEGIKGHRDAVIDGVLVDVKSASTFSFKKFKDGSIVENDPFGYLWQLGSYQHGRSDTDNGRAAFLAIDKQHGHICTTILDVGLELPSKHEVEERTKWLKIMEKGGEPAQCYEPVPDGKSGNMKLAVGCSYCKFKKHCFPGLRTFIYSTGPRYLTEVKVLPKVMEIKDD